jgi:hypothetical protein
MLKVTLPKMKVETSSCDRYESLAGFLAQLLLKRRILSLPQTPLPNFQLGASSKLVRNCSNRDSKCKR